MKSPLFHLSLMAFALSLAPHSGQAFVPVGAIGSGLHKLIQNIPSPSAFHSNKVGSKVVPPPAPTPAFSAVNHSAPSALKAAPAQSAAPAFNSAIHSAPTPPAFGASHSVSSPSLRSGSESMIASPLSHSPRTLETAVPTPATTHPVFSAEKSTLANTVRKVDDPPVPAIHPQLKPPAVASLRQEVKAVERSVPAAPVFNKIEGSVVGTQGHLTHNPLTHNPSVVGHTPSTELQNLLRTLTPAELERVIGPSDMSRVFGAEVKAVSSLSEAGATPARLGQTHVAANMGSVPPVTAPGLRPMVDDLDLKFMNPGHEGSLTTLAAMPPMPTRPSASSVAMVDPPSLKAFEVAKAPSTLGNGLPQFSAVKK